MGSDLPRKQHWGPQNTPSLSSLSYWYIWHWLLPRQCESWIQVSLREMGHQSPHMHLSPWPGTRAGSLVKTLLASNRTNGCTNCWASFALRIIKTSWTLSLIFWVCQNSVMLGWLILNAWGLERSSGGSKWNPYVFVSFTPNSARCEGRGGQEAPGALHSIIEYSIKAGSWQGPGCLSNFVKHHLCATPCAGHCRHKDEPVSLPSKVQSAMPEMNI